MKMASRDQGIVASSKQPDLRLREVADPPMAGSGYELWVMCQQVRCPIISTDYAWKEVVLRYDNLARS